MFIDLNSTNERLSPEKLENNFTLASLASPNSSVLSSGLDFLKKMSYVKLFKGKSQLDVKVEEVGSDARI